MNSWDPTAPYPTQAYSATAHTLNLDKVGVILPTGLHRTKLEAMPDAFTEDILLRLTSYVMSEHLAEDTVTDTGKRPATWWQHLKVDLEGWAWKHQRISRPLRWWLRRHPARMDTVTLTATWTRKATRPMSTLTVRDDRLGPVVYQEQVSKSIKWEDG